MEGLGGGRAVPPGSAGGDEVSNLLPFEVDHFDDRINWRTAYKKLFKRITRVGLFTTEHIERCVREDEQHERDAQDESNFLQKARRTYMSEPDAQRQVRQVYDAWLEYYVIHMEDMREVREYTINGRKVRTSLGLHIFTELTRLNYLLERPRLMVDLYEEEMASLEHTRHPSWVSIVNTFDITGQYEEKEDKDEHVESRHEMLKTLWKRPILMYTQTQAEMVVLFLTQQLNDVKSDSMAEFKSMFEWLWIRVGQLMMEAWPGTVMDDPEMRICVQPEQQLYTFNRDFGVFVACYMGEVLRRFFYYELLSKRLISMDTVSPEGGVPSFGKAQIVSCKEWIAYLISFFADEAFTDLYTETCNESYAFVGDDVWFKYKFPLKVHSRAACLEEMRPHLYRRFFSESRASKASVLNSIETSHVSRFFVLKAISQYIQIKTGGATTMDWYKGVVIHSNDIYMSTYNLQANMAPLLLQVFSIHWAYWNGRVWKCDQFYECIACWFYLLRAHYNCKLFGHDLTYFVSECIGDEQQQQHRRRDKGIVVNSKEAFLL